MLGKRRATSMPNSKANDTLGGVGGGGRGGVATGELILMLIVVQLTVGAKTAMELLPHTQCGGGGFLEWWGCHRLGCRVIC